MPERTEKTPSVCAMSRIAQVLCALSLFAMGAFYSLGILPGVIGAVFSASLLALLLLRGNRLLASCAAGGHVALSVITASLPALLVAVGVILGGTLLARGVRDGEDRFSLSVTLTFSVLLLGAAALVYALYLSMVQAGKSELIPYFVERMDSFATSLTDNYYTLCEKLAALYTQMGAEASVPAKTLIRSAITQYLSITPGLLIAASLLLSLLTTYLLQLFSMLTDKAGEAPLFSQKNRDIRVGMWLSIAYFVVLLVNMFYIDYTSVFSLVFLNAYWVLFPLFGLLGLSFLPRVLRGMRRAERGNASYWIWFILFIILCLVYTNHALLLFGVVYAISVIKNAIRSRRETDKKG